MYDPFSKRAFINTAGSNNAQVVDGATGKLVVKFGILPTGKTVDAAPEHASSNAALDRCIAALFLKWEFPKPALAMGVVYPFVFSKPATLEDTQVVETIRKHQPDVKACYDEALKQKKDLAGRFEVNFSVGPSGQVVASKIASSTMKSANRYRHCWSNSEIFRPRSPVGRRASCVAT